MILRSEVAYFLGSIFTFSPEVKLFIEVEQQKYMVSNLNNFKIEERGLDQQHHTPRSSWTSSF